MTPPLSQRPEEQERWSLYQLELLFHTHARPTPFDQSMILQRELDNLALHDLIRKDPESGSGYRTTPRGEKFIEMLKGTPLPVYADPRSLLPS